MKRKRPKKEIAERPHDDCLWIFEEIPDAALLFLLEESGGAFLNPKLVVQYMQLNDRPRAAERIREIIDFPYFWRHLTKRCFPFVTVLPAHIQEQQRRAFTSVSENEAWRLTLQHVLRVLRHVYVDFSAGHKIIIGPMESNFAPPLSYDRTRITVADHYVNRTCELSNSYTVSSGSSSSNCCCCTTDNYSFQYHINIGESSDDEAAMSDDDIEIAFDDALTPLYAVDLNLLDSSRPSDVFSDHGALVHRDAIAIAEPFAPLFRCTFDIRWHATPLATRFAELFPTMRATVCSTLRVTPKCISSAVLHAIHIRQRHRATFCEQIDVQFDDRRRRASVLTTAGHIFFDKTSLATICLLAEPFTTLTVPIEYDDDDDDIGNTVVSRSLCIDARNRNAYRNSLLGDFYGPPRTHRPSKFVVSIT